MAASFAISRRRTVVPIHNKWETNSARVQVVQQHKTLQLLAFFNEFGHGTCMNFILKSMDTYEMFSRYGKSGLRIVDAKFALPRTDEDNTSRFVCLDSPEYPLEHDDISITFESETGKAFLPLSLFSIHSQAHKLQIKPSFLPWFPGQLKSHPEWDHSGDKTPCRPLPERRAIAVDTVCSVC
jgi:hypothetical protein